MLFASFGEGEKSAFNIRFIMLKSKNDGAPYALTDASGLQKGINMKLKDTIKKRLTVQNLILIAIFIVCIAALLILCVDDGIDFDEAFSFIVTHNYNPAEVIQNTIEDNGPDLPIYYVFFACWMAIFGDSWFICRLSSVFWTVLTMILGATIVRKNWGYGAAYLFIILTAFAPALIHINVNLRFYSLSIFLTTAFALNAYAMTKNAARKNWIIFFVLTLAIFFTHYYNVFGLFLIYIYIFIALCLKDKKQLWKLFASGGISTVLLVAYSLVKNFFHYISENDNFNGINAEKIDYREAIDYSLKSGIKGSSAIWGTVIILFLVAAIIYAIREKRENKGKWLFVILCLTAFPVSYIIGGYVSSLAFHFYTARHVSANLGLLWLGVAIFAGSRNKGIYIATLLLSVLTSISDFCGEYKYIRSSTPELAETLAFIDDNMEPGDIVIYNGDEKFDMLYSCYMQEQEFYHITEVTDLSDFSDKRVWFMELVWGYWFDEDVLKGYNVDKEYFGHYGFQIVGNNVTDFELSRLRIYKDSQ